MSIVIVKDQILDRRIRTEENGVEYHETSVCLHGCVREGRGQIRRILL